MPSEKARPHYCNLASCVHHHEAKRLCLIGLRRVTGECPEYRARTREEVPVCRRMSCQHFYWDNWRGRCRLGLSRRSGQDCPEYRPRTRPRRPG